MKKSFLLLILLSQFAIYSQDKVPYYEFDEIVQQIAQKSQDGEYQEIVDVLSEINENDSIYCTALISQSYYLMALDENEQASRVAKKGLEKDCFEQHKSLYQNIGAALMSMDKYGDAEIVYNEGLKKYPKSPDLLYNKGLALEKLGELEQAVKTYEAVIKIKPDFINAYARMGDLYYKQTRISQALMSYNLYLLMSPDGDNAFNFLKAVNNLVRSTNQNEMDSDIEFSPDDDAFDELDLILSSLMTLSDQYETGNEIDVALTRQNHALIDQLVNVQGSGGFWEEKMIPFYNWIRENNYFDVFIYTICYKIENSDYKKVVERNIKQIKEFVPIYQSKWLELVQQNTVNWHGEEQRITNYIENNLLQAAGELIDGSPVGFWEFYDSDGKLSGIGNFNEEGKRVGDWTWYNKSGDISETATYVDGLLEGENISYYDQGTKEHKATYSKDELVGEYEYFRSTGALSNRKYYKDDQLDGNFTAYFEVGEPHKNYTIEYKQGKVADKIQYYYTDGTLKSEIGYVEGERDGKELQYYHNGQLAVEMTNINGSLNGPYKAYYFDGSLKDEGNLEDGNFVGPYKTYYRDGTVESVFAYDNDELDGPYTYYDTDGKLYYEHEFRGGELIAFKYYNKEGEVIKEDRKKGGEFYYTGYSPEGILTTEGNYDVKGGKQGTWKYYYQQGMLKQKGDYQDNNINGRYEAYFKNGDIESVRNYVNDTLTGYYSDFHVNGKMMTQGWYRDNLEQGEWRYYYLDGTLKSKNFYHKGQLHGVQEYFAVDGKLSSISEYKYDQVVAEYNYDITGKVSDSIVYDPLQETQDVELHYNNGKVRSRQTFKNLILHGPYSSFDYYGNLIVEGTYLNGQQHGIWTYYHPNGQVEQKRSIKFGELHGEFSRYDEEGNLVTMAYYEANNSEKSWKNYHKNGNLSGTTDYINDQPNGRKEFYDEAGNLQLVRFYDHGRLIGYTYLDQNSQELDMIPVENETATIRSFYDNGKISREMEYVAGDFHGKYLEYYYSGILESETFYDKGYINGINTEYYPNGNLKIQEEYYYGDLHGVVKEYFENGVVKMETHYVNDEKHGTQKTYNDKGDLIKTEEYYNGIIYDSKNY